MHIFVYVHIAHGWIVCLCLYIYVCVHTARGWIVCLCMYIFVCVCTLHWVEARGHLKMLFSVVLRVIF